MKIGFDAKRAFTNSSGLGNYSRFVVTALMQQFPEEEYLLYTPKQHALFQNFYAPATTPKEVMPRGAWKRLSSLWRVYGLASEAKQEQLDIFHGLSNELPNGMKEVAKTVVTVHDLIFLRYPELYNTIDRAIYNNKFRRACEQSDRIVAISEQTKQDIISFYHINEAKVEVIYQDCNPIFHQPCDAATRATVREKYLLPEKYVLCVGTHEPRKNQLNLLKAWHEADTDLELVLVGKQTKYSRQLLNYILQHQLEKKVHLLPYIPFQELPAIYQLATAFAYPSVFEGFGIPILEALNSRLPVITSSGSCFSEAGGKGALYINPKSVPDLAAAITKIGKDHALRSQLIAEGQVHAQRFRAEKTIPQLHQLYERLLRA